MGLLAKKNDLLQVVKVGCHGFCSFSRSLKASGLMGSAVSSNWSAKRRIQEQMETQNPLESAYLPSMGLTAVPNMSKLCPLISSLDVSNNIITDLPEHLQRFPNLTLLNISNNQLTTLPAFLSAVIQLKDLRASDNNIRKLPEALILPGLSTLTLCRNYLNQGLSPLLCQSFQSSLHILHLSSNGLTRGVAPRTILKLSALVELDLSLNNLGGDVL
jgi:Leucine-rich repeat (LRR) protein